MVEDITNSVFVSENGINQNQNNISSSEFDHKTNELLLSNTIISKINDKERIYCNNLTSDCNTSIEFSLESNNSNFLNMDGENLSTLIHDDDNNKCYHDLKDKILLKGNSLNFLSKSNEKLINFDEFCENNINKESKLSNDISIFRDLNLKTFNQINDHANGINFQNLYSVNTLTNDFDSPEFYQVNNIDNTDNILLYGDDTKTNSYCKSLNTNIEPKFLLKNNVIQNEKINVNNIEDIENDQNNSTSIDSNYKFNDRLTCASVDILDSVGLDREVIDSSSISEKSSTSLVNQTYKDSVEFKNSDDVNNDFYIFNNFSGFENELDYNSINEEELDDDMQTTLTLDDVSEVINYMKKSDSIGDKLSIIPVLLSTDQVILEKIMNDGGWNLMFLWLDEVKDCITDVPYLVQLLRLFQILPVSVSQLKENPAAKIIKHMIKSEWKEVSCIAREIVDAWLLKIKLKNTINKDPTSQLSDHKHNYIDQKKSDDSTSLMNCNKRANTDSVSELQGVNSPIKIKVKILPPLASQDQKSAQKSSPKPKGNMSGFIDALKSTDAVPKKRKNEFVSKVKAQALINKKISLSCPFVKMSSVTDETVHDGGDESEIYSDKCNAGNMDKKKKCVSWAPQANLCSFHYFILDETERVNVSIKTFADTRRDEIEMEHRMFENVRKQSFESSSKKDSWYRPFLCDSVDNLTEAGWKSTEKQTQANRERVVLQVIYFSRNLVPDSPQEAEIELHEACEIKEIPLTDVTGTGSEMIYEHDIVTSAPMPLQPPLPPPPPPETSQLENPEEPSSIIPISPQPFIQSCFNDNNMSGMMPSMFGGNFSSPPYMNPILPHIMPPPFFPQVGCMGNMMDTGMMCNNWGIIPPPPPPTYPASSSSKTVCMHFKNGSCRFGTNCRFQHLIQQNS